ncbi:MAG: DUF1028 domain-containing protein [Phycisphaerales bacterium JB059]
MGNGRGIGGGLGAAVGIGVLGLGAGRADATWSILLADTRTGEVAVASATCLTGFNLRHNTPVLISGVGGATAQSLVDQTGVNRGVIRDLLLQGVAPDDILLALEASDTGHQTRQYGMLDTQGRTLTFSGSENGQWAGGQTGQVGDLVYAIQGNVLAGEPVVQAAVDAVVTTPGDLPEKLMAAMEAAALFGGDGRCSCESGGPEDCGSPPSNGDFSKSAHIAYMLIARAGDRDICNQIIDTRGLPTSFVITDINQDDRPDVVMTTSAGEVNMGVLTNVTAPDAPLTTLALTEAFGAGAMTLRAAGGDFTGDDRADVAVCSQGADAVFVYPIDQSGTLGSPVTTPVGGGPIAIAAGDFNGRHPADVATVNADGTVSVCLDAGGGSFTVTTLSPVLSGASAVVAADVDADGDSDLALAHESLGVASTLINDGDGSFTPGTFLFVAPQPLGIVRADFNSDGMDDLALPSGSGAGVTVLTADGAGAFSRVDVPAPDGRPVVQLSRSNMNGDAFDDLAAVVSQPAMLAPLINDGGGTLAFGEEAPIPTGVRSIGAGDFSGDGLDDVLIGAQGVSGLMVLENQGGGAFAQELGCAAGDYFMTFNVPNAVSSDPDPVLTLREMFDDWRDELAGRPDAVRSVVTGPSSLVASGEGPADIRLRVELRDWQGAGVSLGGGALSASLAPGSDPVVMVEGIDHLGGGVYEVRLSAAGMVGRAMIEIVAEDGVRPVTLMPAYAVEVLDERLDFDADGVAGFGDVLAFLVAFGAEDPSADLNADTRFDAEDVLMFLGFFGL